MLVGSGVVMFLDDHGTGRRAGKARPGPGREATDPPGPAATVGYGAQKRGPGGV
jgi:hypothetical protein